ncbi:MAG: DegT/DnrJ/EryC1/StrS family aminotransferase [Armatimonadota bacterium]
MANKIPLLDMSPEIESIWDEIMPAIQDVLKKGQFIMGPNVKEFEAEMAAYLGVKHAIACNSGTDALVMGVRALGVGNGDEVITTPFTFFATAEAISHAGATPVFVDIDPVTFNIDVSQIESKITPKTKAIIPVHLYGHAVDMDPVLEIAARRGLKVLEDCAQAFGSEYKGRKAASIGDGGALSFFPSKTMGACGDGGMFTTNNDDVAAKVRMLRAHGAAKKYYNEVIGYNSRLDEIQAAILRIKLRHIDEWNAGRRAVASRYNEMFKDVPGVITPAEAGYTKHVYHQYTVRVTDGKRDEIQKKMGENGVGSFVYYPVPVNRLPVYSDLGIAVLPNSDLCSTEVLSLPIWPKMPHETQKIVAEQFKAAFKK